MDYFALIEGDCDGEPIDMDGDEEEVLHDAAAVPADPANLPPAVPGGQLPLFTPAIPPESSCRTSATKP